MFASFVIIIYVNELIALHITNCFELFVGCQQVVTAVTGSSSRSEDNEENNVF